MQSFAALSPSRDLSSEASFGAPADTFSNVASLSSTPPTTVADDASLASDIPNNDCPAPIGNIEDASEGIVADERPEVAGFRVITTTNTADIADIADTTDTAETAETAETANTTTTAVDENVETPTCTRPEISESSSSTPASTRPRRQRRAPVLYNMTEFSTSSRRSKRSSRGDDVSGHIDTSAEVARNEDGDATAEPAANPAATTPTKESTEAPIKDTIHASDSAPQTRDTKSRNKSKTPKKQEETPGKRTVKTRASGAEAETLTHKLSTLGKRGRKTFEKGVTKLSRELKRLQDTNEYSGIDTRPVVYTTWANGKYVDPSAPAEPPAKKVKVQHDSAYDVPEMEEEGVAEEPAPRKRRVKKWLDRGLYAGQEAPTDIFKGLTAAERKKLAQLPELAPSGKTNKTLPAPMFQGMRLLIEGRPFKLPYDVCNPLPPGQPKPDEWKKITKNRFVGDAGAYWKKTPHFKDYQSKCVCTPEDGCGETCQNRIMLYECDATNCNVGEDLCQNRAFARLQERTKAGGKYRVGVEVIKTSDRGYGIRANRCFNANQIIMEYTGEIITEEECDRRMNEKYKDNQCYYLMSFDQNMIIDATTGSIARFVNHSCQPNCRMVKWIVSGQPRMALFAGDNDIMTGDELTYDYNFDPFSAKNVQKCLCGSPNCRGVLGPKPKEVKPPKLSKEEAAAAKAAAAKESAKGGKRKAAHGEADDDDSENNKKNKKQKTKATATTSTPRKKTTAAKTSIKAPAAGVKRSADLKSAIKRTVSSIAANTKAALGKKKTSKASAAKKTALAKSTKKTVVKKSYGKASAKKLTIMAASAALARAAGAADADAPEMADSPKGDRKTASPRKFNVIQRTAKTKSSENENDGKSVEAQPVAGANAEKESEDEQEQEKSVSVNASPPAKKGARIRLVNSQRLSLSSEKA